MKKKTKKILIWKNKIWESRRLNIGDQYILKEMISNLKEIDYHIEIYLFSDNCRVTRERYDAIPVSIFNPIAVLKSILKADLILFGGGTVLSDKSSLLALIVQISVVIVGILCKKKVVGFAIGVDYLSPAGRTIVRPFLNRLNFITVRDKASKKRLEKMGIVKPPINVTADAAFTFDREIVKPNIVNVLTKEHIPVTGKMLVGISPRRIFHYSRNIFPYSFRKMAGLIPDHVSNKMASLNLILAKVADYLVESYDAEIIFLPMYVGSRQNDHLFSRFSGFISSNDDKACYIIKSMMKHPYKSHIISGEYTQSEFAAIIGSLKFMIGIPLHSLIISVIMNVPILGLIYLPKVKQLLEDLDLLSYGINLQHIDAQFEYEDFIQIIERILKNYEDLGKNLKNSTKQLRQKSKKNYQYLTQFLE